MWITKTQWAWLTANIVAIRSDILALKQQQEKIMSAVSNLTASVVALKAAVADEIADIEAVLAKLQGQTDDPAVVQAVADIQASVDVMKAEHAKVNPPPAV